MMSTTCLPTQPLTKPPSKLQPGLPFLLCSGVLAIALALAAQPARAAAAVGKPAPAFTATDASGKAVSLADFKGRHVVLEWTNPGCPFVAKHYDSGNMQATQAAATAKGAVWLTVNSTAAEARDHLAPASMADWMKSQKAAATNTLMDADGKLGRTFGARTTPHLYVINGAGTLVYAGAIDSKPSGNPADIKTAVNHVNVALGESLAGKPVTLANTQAYGCSIKYSAM